ncbi:MAG: tape measure protein, partial [Candidatus Hydrothermia bacterium]
MKVFIDIIIREAKEIATTISNITTNIASGFKKAFKNISEGIIEFFKAPLVQISALFTGFELFKKISEFGQFQKQLAGLEGSIEKARQKFDELSQSALKYSQSIETAISVYTAFRGVFSEDIATAFTNQLLKISDSLGLNEAQTQSLTRAFIRLFTDSTIGAREFNLVLSQTPQVAGLLAQSLGTSVAELRQKIEEGKISAKELAKAFMEIKPPEPPKTLSEQLSVISQKIALIIYKLGEKLGLWNAIIKALEFVEKVLNGINNIQGKFKSDLASIFSLSKSVFSNLEPIFEKWKIAISKIFELLWNVLVIISKIALIVIDKLKPAFEIILNIITAFVNALLFIIRKVQEFVNFISGQKVEVKAEVKPEIKEPEKTFDISKLQSIPETKTFKAEKIERKEEKDLSFIEKLQLAQKLAEIENATNEELLKRIGLREEEIKALKEK